MRLMIQETQYGIVVGRILDETHDTGDPVWYSTRPYLMRLMIQETQYGIVVGHILDETHDTGDPVWYSSRPYT